MNESMNRRDCLRVIGFSGLSAGIGAISSKPLLADIREQSGFQSSIIESHKIEDIRDNAALIDGKVIQPRREVPVLDKTDVLVVGGGAAGVSAAIAAKRAGAKVILVERYGHFGGLWSGGLVLIIIGHIVTGGKQVCQGIGEEMMRRLDKMDGAIVNRRPGSNPTVDAEAVKYLMVEMVEEASIDVFLHCWGVDAIVEDNTVKGVVFESKAGRQAILAKVVVDATGDGDIFASAGASFEHRAHNIGLVSRLGNLDRVDKDKAPDSQQPRRLGSITPVPGVNWVNLQGPKGDGLDIATLTRMEMNHRKYIWNNVQKTKHTPGYEKVYLMETAPQLGVRITRVLDGLNTVTLENLKANKKFPDVVGVGGAESSEHQEWQIPYGALVPAKTDNVIAAGRCINCDIRMADLVRLIPNCFVTGHAAGVAAAVSALDSCKPRDVDIAKVQKILKQQEAYLG